MRSGEGCISNNWRHTNPLARDINDGARYPKRKLAEPLLTGCHGGLGHQYEETGVSPGAVLLQDVGIRCKKPFKLSREDVFGLRSKPPSQLVQLRNVDRCQHSRTLSQYGPLQFSLRLLGQTWP